MDNKKQRKTRVKKQNMQGGRFVLPPERLGLI